MHSIQTSVLAAVTVICIMPFSANCQMTDNRTTYWVEPPGGLAMQAFMAKMMSLIPQNATADLLGGRTEGYSAGPNLGYEPYWTAVPDIEWADKCKRCSKMFQQYDLVCAVDDTGDVYVNISMCGMMWQNCLGGTASGSVNASNWYFKDFYVVADGWARFSARIKRDLIVLLSNTPSRTPPYYQFILDGWNGQRSEIRRDGANSPAYWFDNKPGIRALTPSPLEFTEFIIRWNRTSGWILITKSSYTNWTLGFFMNYTDPRPFDIKYISFASDLGAVGDYIVNGLLVTNIGPCENINAVGLPRTLATNPTAIAVIDKMFKTYNRSYYTRVMDAGLDPEKKAFSTREEY